MTDILSNIIESTNPGYVYTGSGQSVTVDAGVLVYSGQNDGIVSHQFESDLLFHGNIVSDGSFGTAGVYFDGNTDTLDDGSDGTIRGAWCGVVMNGFASQIYNNGTIIGGDGSYKVGVAGVLIDTSAAGFFQVVNQPRGYIHGGDYGVFVLTQTLDYSFNLDVQNILNGGRIDGYRAGVRVDTNVGQITTIINDGGEISGTVAAVEVDSGGINLYNSSLVDGGIFFYNYGSTDNSVIRNLGRIHGPVIFASGNNVFNGKGGISGAITSGTGNDRLIGGKSKDMIDGGPGHNTLTGGPGHNQFVFDTALDPANNTDRITDFKHGIDKIDLSHTVFTKLNAHSTLHAGMFHIGPHAEDADDRIIYNPAKGWLIYDSNGSAPGGSTHFATLSVGLTLSNTDFHVVA